MTDEPDHRVIVVPPGANGMRLDRFLAARFPGRSRTELVRGIRAGQVRDNDDDPLRPSNIVQTGAAIRIYLPGLAPTEPPPLPPVLHRDDRLIVLNKPPGLMAHPAGTEFVWAAIGLAKRAWPGEALDLAHRLDRDTSGVLVLTRDGEANRAVKNAMKAGQVYKEYVGIARGHIAWDQRVIDAPIGRADGPIRIQMAVRADGLPARTQVEVTDRNAVATLVRCVLMTGRTHQIRVHLDHVGHALVGDRLYGVPPDVFLHAWDHGVDEGVVRAAGAPRHALHAHCIRFPHPSGGGELEVVAPMPDDMARWWKRPEVLPLDAEASRLQQGPSHRTDHG